MAKSKQEILEILKGLNSLPVGDVKAVMDSLEMKFSDWATLTNQRFSGYFDTRGMLNYQISMIQDKDNITYEEFLKVSKFGRVEGVVGLDNNSNTAKHERAKRKDFLQGIPAEELGGRVLTEEEVQILEQIETQWDDARAKYNPVIEVERVMEDVRDTLTFEAPSQQLLPIYIEYMKKNMGQLKKSFAYIDDTRSKSISSTRYENELLSAMQEGIKAFETLQQSQGLGLSEFYKFMEENGVAQADIEQYYKSRLAGMKPDSKPFIMAREGKGFRLNDNGELEIADEQSAKDLIAIDFFRESATVKSIIAKLEQGREYVQLTDSLPSKNLDGLTQSDIQELMQADSIDIKYWMVDNPNKIQKGLITSRIFGNDIDWTEIQDELIDELKNPRGYFEDEMEEEYYKSKVEQALSAMGYDVTAREEDFQGESYDEPEDYLEQEELQTDDLSALSVEELIQRINSNNINIANNEQVIKQALIQKILGQQQQIAEQTAEIDRLKSQKEL